MTAVNSCSEIGNEASDDRRYFWCRVGGCLFELDVGNGRKLTGFRARDIAAGCVTGIFRLPGQQIDAIMDMTLGIPRMVCLI